VKKYFSLLLFLISILSCDVATLSKEEASKINNYRINIQIYDHFEEKLNRITVSLSNGKKQIIDKDIKILVNNKPLYFFLKQELYYTKKSYYYLDTLKRKESYYFEIILRDSTKHPIAFIKPSDNKLMEFNIPKTVSKNENIILKWENLKAPYALEIQKGIQVKNKVAKNITEYGYSKTKFDTIKSKKGNYKIDKSYYEDSLTIATRVEFNLSRKEIGLINPLFKKNSNLTYNFSLNKSVEIK